MKRIFSKIIVVVLVFSLITLSACSGTSKKVEAARKETIAAATMISARLNQIYMGTMFAEMTLQAIASFTPTITQTPTSTQTPTTTNTYISTSTYTYTPTFTPTITVTRTITPTPSNTFTSTIKPTNTPTVTPTSTNTPLPCNVATFDSDVTVANGSVFAPGETFVKTWRIKNSGSCTWTTGYAFYFSAGDLMGAKTSVSFPNSVAPGATVDLTVTMKAPSTEGSYSGSWLLTAPDGTSFGVGSSSAPPFLPVSITVASLPTPSDPNIVHNFLEDYCSAQWLTNSKFINCPTGAYDYTNGTIMRTLSPTDENGTVYSTKGALITIPANGTGGYIRGQFPAVAISSGDYFAATVMCTFNATSCNATFEVLYQISGQTTINSLGTFQQTYDGAAEDISIDLSSLDGQNVIFFLKVSANNNSTNDFAQWVDPRITNP